MKATAKLTTKIGGHKTVATITTELEHQGIADWLRRRADEIEQEGKEGVVKCRQD